MTNVRLLHNPDAGEAEHGKKHLTGLLESEGFQCSYSSTKKKGWEKIESADLDFIAVAGGDGTVRKVARELLSKSQLEKKLPIGLLPLGTANNISKTLGVKGSPEEIIKRWADPKIVSFDIAMIKGLKDEKFFMEGFGYGLFPKLMREMEKQKGLELASREENIKTALEVLLELIETSKARPCKMLVDGVDYSGTFLLVEIMNIQSIGPNLNLAPLASPSDGELDLVFISEGQRSAFANYVKQKTEGIENPSSFNILKAKKIQILWEGNHLHVDDRYIVLDDPKEITIEIREGLLQFYA